MWCCAKTTEIVVVNKSELLLLLWLQDLRLLHQCVLGLLRLRQLRLQSDLLYLLRLGLHCNLRCLG